MTRTFTAKPVWTWACDQCGFEAELARGQRGLPRADEMRARGWSIAKMFGDKCPACVAEESNRRRRAEEIRAAFTAYAAAFPKEPTE